MLAQIVRNDFNFKDDIWNPLNGCGKSLNLTTINVCHLSRYNYQKLQMA